MHRLGPDVPSGIWIRENSQKVKETSYRAVERRVATGSITVGM